MKTTKWILDPAHSELGFKVRHLMISHVSGSFTSFRAEAKTDGEDFSTAKINVTVDMASISTNNEQRDAHLRNADFFEVAKYPELRLTSTRIEETGTGTFALYGDLTLKGVTKPVRLEVEHSGITRDPWGGERAGFSLSGRIRRSDWGVSFNNLLETGGLALGEEVKIAAELQMVKQPVEVLA